MAKAKTNSNVTVNPEMMEMFNAFMQFMANNSNDGVSDSKTKETKEKATTKDFSKDLEIIKKDGKWYVCASKYADGKNKGERKIFSHSRLNKLSSLCDELTKGKDKAVYTKPEKIGRGKWIPFYVTCSSEKVAKNLVATHTERITEWYKTASAEDKKKLDGAMPEFLR